jgi:hypothetical protein
MKDKKRVFLIEASRNLQRGITDSLNHLGILVICAASYQEVLEILRLDKDPIHLVVFDSNNIGVNGQLPQLVADLGWRVGMDNIISTATHPEVKDKHARLGITKHVEKIGDLLKEIVGFLGTRPESREAGEV